jgi:type IV pilus assembly protein PilC
MAFIGSKAGSLDQSMAQIAESYQEEVDSKINQMLSIIEPTLVVLLSLIVGVILLSVMFPLIGIMSSL